MILPLSMTPLLLSSMVELIGGLLVVCVVDFEKIKENKMIEAISRE